jgi:hypothetical protein
MEAPLEGSEDLSQHLAKGRQLIKGYAAGGR